MRLQAYAVTIWGVFLLLVWGSVLQSAAAKKPLRVLLLAAGEGHDTTSVVSALRWVLMRRGDMQVTVSREVGGLSAQGLRETDVLLLFAPGVPLDEPSREALHAFVRRGGGILYLHGVPGTGEGSAGNVTVQPQAPRHPVIRDLPPFQVNDAPAVAATIAPSAQVLARGKDGQPLVWVQGTGKGREFFTTLGHMPSAWNHPSLQKLVLNAVYWCAGRNPPPPPLLRPPKGFVSLFNGVNLEGWGEVGPACWSVQDGVVQCSGQSESTGWLRSNRMYRNFVLRLEYRIAPGGNSGIFLRAPHFGRSSRLGVELQIQDDRSAPPSNTCTSALYSVVTPRLNPAKPAGEWNQVEVTFIDRHLRVVWNGHLVHDIHLDDPALSANLPRTHLLYRRPNWGYIGLQNHRSLVEFRNIFIKELD